MAKKILIIDDEVDVLQIVRAVLTTKGHEVIEAHGGEEGLQKAELHKPDLIICDLMMPRVSGLEVIKRLRKNEELRQTPMIVLSALGNEEERNPDFWVRTLGVDDYVQKPFDPLDLLGRVEYIFRRSSYGTQKATAAEPSKVDQDGETLMPVDLSDANPTEVVRAFVESWNRQDFATEYQAMGEEMVGQMGLHDYVGLRRQTYLEEKGQERWQRVADVIDEKVSLNVAKVVIDRENTVNGQSGKRRETYSLKKTNKGWKIIMCRSTKA